MTRVFRNLTVFFILLSLSTVALGTQTIWKRVSLLQFSWNQNTRATVIFEIPSDREDPGDFTRLRIATPGHKELLLSNEDGWVKWRTGEISSEFSKAAKNIVASEYALVINAAPGRALLFLFGYSYASSPGSLDVIELSNLNEPKVIFHRKEFGLTELRDLDSSGVAEIVGYACLGQSWGHDFVTYDPLSVYKLSGTKGETASYSLLLSKQYTLKHYYGWAGPECREDVAVVLHPPKGGKPILMKSSEAEKLFEAKSK
jgi:hypothetical protein